jgi:hypothetical protein
MSRSSLRSLLLLLGPMAGLAVGAFWQSPQGAPPPQEGARAEGFISESALRRRELERGLIGLWNLTRFVHPDRTPEDGEVIGAAHFAEDLMTIMLHARRQPLFSPDANFFVQAGLHHWRITDVNRLHTATIIGHNDLTGRLVYETSFQPREFDVRIDDNGLVLTRPDGARLEFTRVQESEFPQAAIDRLREARAARAGVVGSR